ncbi:MAG: uroporphyrinogen-III C-methyltransferase [Tissierellia bacterium]|nr:uroporphyrinogen-III C-methyltransferase [Tissierellia bacterium]
MNKGKVKIVGAGIGPSDLITIRGKEALEDADVIIFDRLLNEDLIAPYKGKKELYYAGKAAGDHYLTQDEINTLMVEKAKENKIVVRLKGGDPYVFGRGGEEALYCVEHGVDFEVIPGVTSGIVSLMYAGIPATHRDICTSVSFITGHRKKGVIGTFQEYGKLEGNLVFYMGLKNLPKITKELIEGGMDSGKPAAVIMNGGYPNQKTFVSTVGRIAEEIKDKEFGSPSLIVIGDGVSFRGELNFYEKLPLFGKRIVVTRARSQASKMVKSLEALGAEVLQAPTIEIQKINEEGLKEAIAHWDYTHIVFHSVNGIRFFFDEFLKVRDLRDLAGIKCCVIGDSTAKLLKEYGIHPDIIPDRYVGEELIDAIRKDGMKDRKILLPHSKTTRETLLNEYESLGKIHALPIYASVMPEQITELPDEVDYILFMSSTTVKNFIEIYGKKILNQGKVISIGPITTDTLESEDILVYKEAAKATIKSMVECIKEDVQCECEE